MHVDTDLSAYLDGELLLADRARVDAHLDTCDRCRARLRELRATASLVAALPSVRPARSLVPHVVERWNWLRPIRSLSAVASVSFLFVFLVTAIARSGSGLGGGSPTGAFAPVAAPPATAATTTAGQQPAAPRPFLTPPQLPVPAAVPLPASTAAADAARSAGGASPPAELVLQPTAAPKAVEAATPTSAPRAEIQASPEAAARTSLAQQGPSPLTDPFLWLGLAVIAAVSAIAAHRRLRTT